jgi:hypothetical protein
MHILPGQIPAIVKARLRILLISELSPQLAQPPIIKTN